MSHRLTRGVALVATTATLALVATTAPAVAGPAQDQKQAARWLAGEPIDGLVETAYEYKGKIYEFTDYGLSIDLGLALRAQGRRGGTVAVISERLAGAADSYTTGVDFGTDDVYAGATAKLASFVTLTGGDPAAFGGVDLVERLEGLVSSDPATVGRLEDVAYGDNANTIGQAFAAHALTEAGAAAAVPVTSYLLDQQCAAGYFRLAFTRRRTLRTRPATAATLLGDARPTPT